MDIKGISFVQHNKLQNVIGRIRYISDKKKQENLYAVYDKVAHIAGLQKNRSWKPVFSRVAESEIQR